MYVVGDSVQVLIKNGDWNKKFIDDKIMHLSSPRDILTIGIRQPMSNNDDFNDYLNVGCFCVNAINTMLTLLNRPCDEAGVLDVFDGTGNTADRDDAYTYRIQKYTTYLGDVYYRGCSRYESSWVFGTWDKSLDTTDIKDYIVEQGTSGEWTYRKWNSGICEAWQCRKSGGTFTTTADGALYSTDVISLSFPSFFVSLEQVLSKCNFSGWYSWDSSWVTDTKVQFKIYTTQNVTTAQYIRVNLYIKGTWK
jgi:hypothetical protein